MTFIAILLGLGAIVGGGFLGYSISKMRNSENPDLRGLGVVLTLMLMLCGAFFRFSNSDNSSTGNPIGNASSIQLPEILSIAIDDTITQNISAGESKMLTYAGELGEIITLRINAPREEFPFITVLVTPTGESTPKSVLTTLVINDISPIPSVLCGYRLPENGRYAFGFQARVSGEYTITFERGNTCNNTPD